MLQEFSSLPRMCIPKCWPKTTGSDVILKQGRSQSQGLSPRLSKHPSYFQKTLKEQITLPEPALTSGSLYELSYSTQYMDSCMEMCLWQTAVTLMTSSAATHFTAFSLPVLAANTWAKGGYLMIFQLFFCNQLEREGSEFCGQFLCSVLVKLWIAFTMSFLWLSWSNSSPTLKIANFEFFYLSIILHNEKWCLYLQMLSSVVGKSLDPSSW